MSARLLKGKAVSERLLPDIRRRALAVAESRGSAPMLAVLAVGGNGASEVYLRTKLQACKAAGIEATVESLPESAGEAAVLSILRDLGSEPTVDGILLEMPLPAGLDSGRVCEAVAPDKDVEGITTANFGRFFRSKSIASMRSEGVLIPCTADSVIRLLLETGVEPAGLDAAVVGRSNIVGRPAAHLLSCLNATVTLCHSRTRDLERHVRASDIVVAAVGRAGFIRGDWIKPGAVVIDAGMNPGAAGVVGDVEFGKACEAAGFISPVPGGVGPLTVTCLLDNVVLSAERRTR
jgi:methylenetetrahydrofolate dehydrogenase (NADP+)/methenyltetrahydrofolate cyclohydrolase